jgi:hypothetical protein
VPTGIDIWIAKPGSACTVDDHDWVLTVDDAHGSPYSWAGDSYASLPAPIAHWAGAIPPGTYVVHGRRTDGSKRTDSAIVAIDPGEIATVRLWVAGDQPDEPLPEDECDVTIGAIRAAGRETVQAVDVQGTVTGCQQLEVEFSYRGRSIKAKTSTKKSVWRVKLDVGKLEVPCGETAEITVRCREHRTCIATERATLNCAD